MHRLQKENTRSNSLINRGGQLFSYPFDVSSSFPTATVALSSGAGLSLSYLPDFPGPPQKLQTAGSQRIRGQRRIY